MQRTKEDIYALIERGETFHLECKKAQGGLPSSLWESLSRKFYRLYPIANTLCAQLNWSQYKLLISIEEPEKREYYQLEAVSNCWTKRELERQLRHIQ